MLAALLVPLNIAPAVKGGLDTFLPQFANFQPSYSEDELARFRRLERKLRKLRNRLARQKRRAAAQPQVLEALGTQIAATVDELFTAEDEEMLAVALLLDRELHTFLHLTLVLGHLH